jgi:aminomethyltransferase
MYYKNIYKTDDMKREQHEVVRRSVGWYDFTHQLVEVTGPDASAFLDRMYACPIANLRPGRDRYTTMLNEQGEIIDDVVVLRLGEERFWVSTLYSQMTVAWFEAHKGEENAAWADVTADWRMYSIQGPKSKDALDAIVDESIDGLKFFANAENSLDGTPVRVNRAGFTGEKFGYEIYVPKDKRDEAKEKIDKVVTGLGGKHVDEFQIQCLTLPGEKGFYLMRDLAHTNPFEVGLDRNIDFDRDFVGKDALLAIRESGPAHEMLGFTVDKDDVNIHQKCFGGPGEAILLDGEEIGRVSKFTFSYELDKNIGYAYVTAGVVKPGDHVQIHGEDAVICERPFI